MIAQPDIFQAFAGQAQRAMLSPCAIPHDVAGNTANDAREYELFRRIHASRPAGAGPWGLVSAKFELKTMVPLEAFRAFAVDQFARGADCVFINPMIGNEAIHSNVWEQWWVANPDVTGLCEFLETVGPVHSGSPMGADSFAFCNYFLGTERFWAGYFAYVERFSAALERERQAGSAVGAFYGSDRVYSRNAQITSRPFIIERLFSAYLATHPQVTRAAWGWSAQDFAVKFGTRLGEILHHLSTLKNLALRMRDQTMYERWTALRAEMYSAAVQVIWSLDDPPELFNAPELRPSLARGAGGQRLATPAGA